MERSRGRGGEHMNSFRVYLIISLVIFLLICPQLSYAGEKYFIKFATIAPEGTAWMIQMRALDKTLREKSQGKLRFRFYPGGVAGDEPNILKKMRIGQIHCAGFTGVGPGEILPEVRVLDLPFLFRNYHEVDLARTELRDYFSDKFREKGFEMLAWTEVGNVHLFSKKPIRRIEDLSGLKIWQVDQVAKVTFSAMGNNPIPLPITDVTTALNTGMIDTVYAPPLGALAFQWHTYTKYMSALPLNHTTGAILITKKAFDSLPPELAQLLKDTLNKGMIDLTSKLRKDAQDAVKEIQKSGLEVVPAPTGPELEKIYKVHDQVAQGLTGKLFSKELLDRVYVILKRSR
jgi:TRAP-type C4-dicarboxylate transport system substrate-binding protein